MQKRPNNSPSSDNRKLQAFLKKLLLCALVIGLACYTVFFYAPFAALADSETAISYTHRDVWHILALTAVLILIPVTAIVMSLGEKAFRIVLTVVFSLAVCCCAQVLLLNRSSDVLNGNLYRSSVGYAIFNGFVWLAVIAGWFYVMCVHQKLWRKLLLYTSAGLLVLLGAITVGIGLSAEPNTPAIEEYSLSTEDMYQFSTEDNVLVFVLDRLDYYYLDMVLQENPGFFDELDGFTCYTNAMSAYARTKPALNNMLTGSEQAYRVSAEEFLTDSWTEDGKDLLGTLQNNDYTVELYTNPSYLFADADYAEKNVDNLERNSTLQSMAVLPNLLRLSLYQSAPNAIKGALWADIALYHQNVYVFNDAPGYSFNDPLYGQGFRDATAERTKSSFKFYHFYGSHNPYTMKADGTAAKEGESPTVTDQTMGSFYNLYRAFDRLKTLGIYEDATIIITADHGRAISDGKPVQEATRIGLFYKPSGSAGTPLAYSDAPVSTGNIPATIMQAVGFRDISLYGTPLDQVAEDASVTRKYYKTTCPKGSGPEADVYEYTVTGDASDMENWEIVNVTKGMPLENSFY